MKNVKRMPKLIGRCKRAVYAIAAAVLAGSMFLGTGVTAEAVKLADVFDTQAYANKYPDLFAAFGNNATALLKHYKEHGISERREVEGILDVVRYREAYPDLEAAFGDNWDAYVNHYLIFGAKEGRENFTEFDGLAYAERYPDLKEAYGDDLLELYKHYQAFGKDEGRNAETYDEPEDVDEDDGTYTVYEYYEDGSVKRETVYENGRKVSFKGYRSPADSWYNVLADHVSYEEVYTYDSNGQLIRHEGFVYSMAPYSDVTEYFNGKKVKSTYTIYSGRVGGKYLELTAVVGVQVNEYNDDEKVIKSTFYDSNGKMTRVEEYEYDSNGKMKTTKRTEYDGEGNVKSERTY